MLQTFGCLCFLYLRDYVVHKLAPHLWPCVFLGYSSLSIKVIGVVIPPLSIFMSHVKLTFMKQFFLSKIYGFALISSSLSDAWFPIMFVGSFFFFSNNTGPKHSIPNSSLPYFFCGNEASVLPSTLDPSMILAFTHDIPSIPSIQSTNLMITKRHACMFKPHTFHVMTMVSFTHIFRFWLLLRNQKVFNQLSNN